MAAASLRALGATFKFEDSIFTFNISDDISATTANSTFPGLAVAIDTSVVPAPGDAPTVRICHDGDEIFGFIETVEYRSQSGLSLASVTLRHIGPVPMKAGETPAPGAQMIGGGNGTLKTRVPTTFVDTGTTGTTITLNPGRSKPCTVYAYDGTANLVYIAFGI